MDFVKEHAAADGGDLSHVYLVGDSGGACLATYANAIQNSKKIAKAAGIKPSELKVHALGLISGMFYTTKFDKIGLFFRRVMPLLICLRNISENFDIGVEKTESDLDNRTGRLQRMLHSPCF